MFSLGFQQRSGRVIALGRAVLGSLFLLAIWLDASQPAQAVAATYGLLSAYALFAITVTLATWNNWWLDAKLAGPAHVVDMTIFTVLVVLTEGYTSPFFIFFVFLLLSAAIRWGWRETALTAAVLILLYLAIGFAAAAASDTFQLQRFIIRSGHLIILSAILIWFGVYQGTARPVGSGSGFPPPSFEDSPLESGLAAAAGAASARSAVLLWHEADSPDAVAVQWREGEVRISRAQHKLLRASSDDRPFLYDLARNRALTRNADRRVTSFSALEQIDEVAARARGISEGLAVPLQVDTGYGELFLQEIESLGVDHIEVGAQVARDLADHIRRHALLKAVEESGEARARLSLARDLHDSVVQFLAGAGFRIEAMMRHARAGQPLEPELQELKRLMLEEQGDLRSFINVLRSGREIGTRALADELETLAARLSDQWRIGCNFSSRIEQRMIPMRLNLDVQQLVREAVANAVRHGKAKRVQVSLAAEDDHLCLQLADDGRGFPGARNAALDREQAPPRSLQERVAEAGGTLSVQTAADGTSLTIRLPITGRQQ